MFGTRARLEQRLDAAQTQLTQVIAQFGGHVNECSTRASESARKLDKLEASLEKSTDAREKSIKSLDEKFELKHKENRKFFYAILLAVVTALGAKVFDYIHFGPPVH